MNSQLLYGLMMCETDIDGAMRRFSGDEPLYLACLEAFLSDRTVEQLDVAIEQHQWDEAFTAAHALKGVAGNMGFVPLFHATGELVIVIRAGRLGELGNSMKAVRRCYNDIIAAITQSGVIKYQDPQGGIA